MQCQSKVTVVTQRFSFVAGLLWLMCSGSMLCRAEALPLPASQLAAGETVDVEALLDDPHWQGAPVFDAFVEQTPVNGARAKYLTQVQILLADRDLFVAVRAADPEPGAMRAHLGPHDSVGNDQDHIILYIDSVGNRKAAQYFSVNPFGATADGVYTDNNVVDAAPDFDFQTRARRDAGGYTVVFRLPFSTLRFASANQGQWRMLVERIMPREVSYQFNSALIPSDAHDGLGSTQAIVDVDLPRSGTFVRVMPGLSAIHATEQINDGPKVHQQKLEPSLDVKWRPAAEVIADATINPDFSQVELDVPQLKGNTRFALKLDEKRPFFQESADLWQMPTAQLYTRSIADPDWGVRITRRTDRDAGTALIAKDQGGSVVLLPAAWQTAVASQPASLAGAARMRWDAGAGHLAWMATGRDYADGRGTNSVVGTDFSHEWSQGFKLRGQLLGSSTTAQPDANGELVEGVRRNGSYLWLALKQRAVAFERSIQYERIGTGFRNDSGFITQTGVQTVTGELDRIWRNRGNVMALRAYVYGAQSGALTAGQTVSEFVRPGIQSVFDSGLNLKLEPRVFELQRVAPQSVLHREHYLHMEMRATPAEWLSRVALTLDMGRMTDFVADRITPAHRANLDMNWLVTRRASVALTLQHQGDALWGVRHYSEAAAQLKAGYSFTPEQELRLIGEYHRLRRDPDAAVASTLIRETGRTLSLTYIYTRARYRAMYLGATHARGTQADTTRHGLEAYLKLVYAFEWLQ